MKKLFVFLLLLLIVNLIGCAEECDNKNPTVLLVNNGTNKADIQIKTSGGNTENINNIFPGDRSEKRSFSPGNIEFTITIQGVQEDILYSLTTNYCTEYTVTINENNIVTGSWNKLDKRIYP